MHGQRVGLPRLHKEAGERRDFLPPLLEAIDRFGATEIVIEDGYGSGMDVPMDDYLAASRKARLGSYEECFAQDIVLALRCPDEAMIRSMKPGSVLVAMLHFPTRPSRIRMLSELGIHGVSLDSVADGLGTRFIQNMAAVGWNGVRAAFGELAKSLRGFDEPTRRPIRVTLMGSGAVGGHALNAAIRYGDNKVRARLGSLGAPGVQVTVIDYELTAGESYMLTRLEQTDLLIDATQRRNPSQVIVPNDWVAALPEHAVILDLAVDPYDFSVEPPEVKGIEGIPEGNLDQYVFAVDDPAYTRIDRRVKTKHRRIALSCYSWPGVEPKACMEIYGTQIEPVMRALVEVGVENLSPNAGPYYDRATARAILRYWKEPH